MSPIRIAALLSAIAVVGAGAVVLWSRDDRAPRAAKRMTEERPGDRGPAPSDDDLDRRVALLEARVVRLEREAMLRQRARPAGEGGAAGRGAVVDNPVFEAAVRDVFERVDGEQEEQRRERRQRRMMARATELTDELAENLSLDDAQKQKVEGIMRGSFERMIEARGNPSGADAGRGRWGGFRAAREALEKDIGAVLTPAQRQQAEALKESGELPGWWGRGRRGRE